MSQSDSLQILSLDKEVIGFDTEVVSTGFVLVLVFPIESLVSVKV